MSGTVMMYGGIALAAIGLILFILQLRSIKKRSGMNKEAATMGDMAPVAVTAAGKGKNSNREGRMTVQQDDDSIYKATEKLVEYEKTMKLKTQNMIRRESKEERTTRLEG